MLYELHVMVSLGQPNHCKYVEGFYLFSDDERRMRKMMAVSAAIPAL